VPAFHKEAILASDGDDTVLTTLADSFSGRDWPGAWDRMLRTRFVAEWLGREPELRRRRGEIWRKLEQAEEANDSEYALLWVGQSAGLIDAVVPAADVVREIVRDAEEVIRTRLRPCCARKATSSVRATSIAISR
jgi:nitronate monooxygenase